MNPIALVHPTNTISPLEILEHLDPLFGGGDLRQQSRLFDLRAPRCAAASVPIGAAPKKKAPQGMTPAAWFAISLGAMESDFPFLRRSRPPELHCGTAGT
jgi:hypothetical protein